MASASVYELSRPAEENLSIEVWKWKLHALKRSRRAITQVIPMPASKCVDLTPVYSSGDRWQKVYTEMEHSHEIVHEIWQLTQDRVQQHRLLRMTIREDFLEQLVRHCTDHARELAEKENKINIEAKRVEMRDIQIKMQNRAFEEIVGRLNTLRFDDDYEDCGLSSDILSACLQGVRKHVRISKQLKEDRERLLQEVADKENEQNELRQQVQELEAMIEEMESKERNLSRQLFQTQDDHKRDVTRLISHIEGLIQDNKKLVRETLNDREEYKKDIQQMREQHKKEISDLLDTFTVMQGFTSERTSKRSSRQNSDSEINDNLDAVRSTFLKTMDTS